MESEYGKGEEGTYVSSGTTMTGFSSEDDFLSLFESPQDDNTNTEKTLVKVTYDMAFKIFKMSLIQNKKSRSGLHPIGTTYASQL